MKTFLSLIRWKNILLVAATMFAMKYAVIIPVYKFFDVSVGLSDLGFYFLVCSAMLIMAAGNIINDYFDRKSDFINRPRKVIVGFRVKRRQAIFMHSAFSVIGCAAGFVTSFIVGKPALGFFFILITFLLWLYSSSFKKKAFLSNFIVALLTACIPFIVGVTEYFAFEQSISEWNIENLRPIKTSFQIIIGFSIFAFFYNFIIETIKDCSGYKGDLATGTKSIPVKIGLKKTNYIISIISFIAIVLILIIWHTYIAKLSFFQDDKLSQLYLYCFVVLPGIFLSIRSLFGTKRKKYKFLLRTTKFIMIFGMLFSIIFSFAVYDKI